uniref:Uncharacterized protein n=1 Tax=Arundo donax TaxID=35708 RepID=A0A0A9FSK1_ARUDO
MLTITYGRFAYEVPTLRPWQGWEHTRSEIKLGLCSSLNCSRSSFEPKRGSMINMTRGLLFKFAWITYVRIKRPVMIIARHSLQTKLNSKTERAGSHLRMSDQASVVSDEKTISSIVQPTVTMLSKQT